MHTIGKKKRWFLSKFRLPNSGPGNAANCILETPILQISRGGACPRTPVGVRASGTQRSRGANGARPPAEPLHPVLPNATENPDR